MRKSGLILLFILLTGIQLGAIVISSRRLLTEQRLHSETIKDELALQIQGLYASIGEIRTDLKAPAVAEPASEAALYEEILQAFKKEIFSRTEELDKKIRYLESSYRAFLTNEAEAVLSEQRIQAEQENDIQHCLQEAAKLYIEGRYAPALHLLNGIDCTLYGSSLCRYLYYACLFRLNPGDTSNFELIKSEYSNLYKDTALEEYQKLDIISILSEICLEENDMDGYQTYRTILGEYEI